MAFQVHPPQGVIASFMTEKLLCCNDINFQMEDC